MSAYTEPPGDAGQTDSPITANIRRLYLAKPFQDYLGSWPVFKAGSY